MYPQVCNKNVQYNVEYRLNLFFMVTHDIFTWLLIIFTFTACIFRMKCICLTGIKKMYYFILEGDEYRTYFGGKKELMLIIDATI